MRSCHQAVQSQGRQESQSNALKRKAEESQGQGALFHRNSPSQTPAAALAAPTTQTGTTKPANGCPAVRQSAGGSHIPSSQLQTKAPKVDAAEPTINTQVPPCDKPIVRQESVPAPAPKTPPPTEETAQLISIDSSPPAPPQGQSQHQPESQTPSAQTQGHIFFDLVDLFAPGPDGNAFDWDEDSLESKYPPMPVDGTSRQSMTQTEPKCVIVRLLPEEGCLLRIAQSRKPCVCREPES